MTTALQKNYCVKFSSPVSFKILIFSCRFGGSSSHRTFTLSTDFTCHGKWSQDEDESKLKEEESFKLSPTLSSLVDYNALASSATGTTRQDGSGRGGGSSRRHLLVLSTGPSPKEADNSLSRRYLCLSYSEGEDGVLLAEAGSCSVSGGGGRQQAARGARDQQSSGFYWQQQQSSQSRPNLQLQFNITSSGPCLQALTGTGTPAATTVTPATAILSVLTAALLAS